MMATPEFGKDVRRDFEVSSFCYDCAVFYDGCPAWRASRDFACRDFNRLPDVGIDGKLGQEFPPSRRRTNAGPEPAPEPIEQQPVESSQGPALEQDQASLTAIDTPQMDWPTRRPRICDCGAELPKGKRLCETYRTENRRRTLRTYMQNYRKQDSAAVVGPDQDGPFSANSTHAE
jgi:hypothetical protein